MLVSVARVLRSFSPLSSSITRSDLNLALKFLLCLDIMMNPHFHTDFSISDSLIFVRKSVFLYETIIVSVIITGTILRKATGHRRIYHGCTHWSPKGSIRKSSRNILPPTISWPTNWSGLIDALRNLHPKRSIRRKSNIYPVFLVSKPRRPYLLL